MRIFISAVIAVLLVIPVYAQVMIKAKPEEIIDLAEVASIIIQKEDKVVVEAVMPVELRLKVYRDVDIQQGDQVLMANGKRIDKVKDLIDIYEYLKTDEELKLGLKRDEKMLMISFNKANPDDLPKQKKVMMKVDDKGKKKIIKSENVDDEELKKIIDEADAEEKQDIEELTP